MKIVIAPDSFKESLSARAAANAIETGLRRVLPAVEVVKIPLADGGEGTVDALLGALGCAHQRRLLCFTERGGPAAVCGCAARCAGAAMSTRSAATNDTGINPPSCENYLVITTFVIGQLITRAATDATSVTIFQ